METNMKKAFKINDLVWCKLKGYDYWPAQIIDPKLKPESEKRPDDYCVQFIGHNTYSFQSEETMCDYKENKEKYTKKSQKEVKKCYPAYKNAIKLAEEYLETIEMEALCGSCCVEYLHVSVDSDKWFSEMTQRLLHLQRSNILTDMVMWDGCGTKICLHSAVLAACSTFWQNVFREMSSNKVTRSYSARCSPLNKRVWEVIISLMYTGESEIYDNEDHTQELMQQMQSMKLNTLLTHLAHPKDKPWRATLMETIFSYQQDNKLTDTVLVDHDSKDMLSEASGSGDAATTCGAHMFMLMAASDYLRARFATTATLGKYTLGINASRNRWRNLIELVYVGTTDVARSDAVEMGKIVRKLRIPFMLEAMQSAPTIDWWEKDAEEEEGEGKGEEEDKESITKDVDSEENMST